MSHRTPLRRSRRDATLVPLFHEQAASRPDAIAVELGAEQVSYATLRARATRRARELRAKGVGADVIVGVALERSIDTVVTLIAVLEAGGAYAPLDLRYPAARLRFMLADTRATLVITRSAHRILLADVADRIVCIDEPSSTEGAVDGAFDDLPDTHPEQLANVMYTSGSTGAPKGVAVTHRNVVHLITDTNYVQLTPASRVLHTSLLGFDASTFEIWGALVNGARLVIFAPLVPDPRQLAEVIARSGVTTGYLTSGLFQKMVELEPDAVRRYDQVLTGGEVLSVPHAQRVTGNTSVVNVYGPTEITAWGTFQPIDGRVEAPAPIGEPITGATIHVLDATLDPVCVETRGELCLGGDGVARGYLNRPALTAERFVPSPFGPPGARIYRTGDIGRWRDDGQLDFVGREDDQIKLRGFRIEMGEVEAALRAHPDVLHCVAVVRERETGDRVLLAYVIPRDAAPSTDDLRAFLRRTLPDYMVPSAFVMLASWPLTPAGKVDKAALPVPDFSASSTGRAAATEDEEVLCALFAETLGLDRVGVDDDFFALGGHSLLAMQLASRIRTALGVELTLDTLLDARSVAALAPRLRQPSVSPPPLAPRPRPARVPVSYAQRRLWVAEQLEREAAPYNLPYALRLRGPLDVDALDRALQALVARHDALRTRFGSLAGEPIQIVDAVVAAPLHIQEIHAAAEDDRRGALADAAAVMCRERFDLARAPLFRLRLLRFAEDDHALVWVSHHLISDGWSEVVFTRDLAALYAASCAGESSALPPLPVQYADYALWQREWFDESRLREGLGSWTTHLAGAPPQLDVPGDRPRPAVQRLIASSLTRRLGGDRLASLRAFGLTHGATLYMTLLAGFAALLARYTGQSDLVIGTPSTHRPDLALEPLIGFFVNSLPLRLRADADVPVRELLADVRRSLLHALRHQDVPFERIVEAIAPERTSSRAPLYQVVFDLQQARPATEGWPDLQVEPVPLSNGYLTCDLELHAVASADDLEFTWRYDRDMFDPWRIEQMARHFEAALDAFVAAAGGDRLLRQISVLSDDERRRLVPDDGDRTPVTPGTSGPPRTPRVPRVSPVAWPALFSAQVARVPDAIAVADGDEATTYAALDARVEQLAARLDRNGAGAERLIAVLLPRSCRWVEAVLAVLRTGSVYLPIEPSWPAARIAAILAESRPIAIVTDGILRALVPADASVACIEVDDVRTVDAAAPESARRAFVSVDSAIPRVDINGVDAVACAPGSRAPVLVSQAAYVIYTSGSTGAPKGVVVTHRGIAALAEAQHESLGVDTGSVVLQFASAAFDASVWELIMALTTGATLAIAGETSRGGTALSDVIARHGVTHMTVPPLVLTTIDPRDVPSLTTLVVAGDACASELTEQWARGRRLINAYGPTETTVCSTMSEDVTPGERPPIGRALVDAYAYVLGPSLELLPAGVPGELYVGGVSLARGYLASPALTASRFIADPYGPPGARVYRTGDGACWRRDGQLEFLGRRDRQIKIRGFRVEPGEVEAALLAQPSIAQAAVVMRRDDPEVPRLVAYVVAAGASQPIDRARIVEALAERLPDYMVPRTIVELPRLPLSTAGKIAYAELPAPESASRATSAPATPAEHALAAVWQEVLHCGPVDRDANFFALGGDSISCIHVVARARRAGWALEVWDMFQHPTLAALAAAARPEAMQAAARMRWTGDVPAAPIQRWFWQGDRTAAHHYNQAVWLTGSRWHGRSLLRAIDAVLQRHDMLRMRWSADGTRQWIAERESTRVWATVDLRALAPARHAAALAAIERRVQASLDVHTGPVIRAVHVRVTDDAHDDMHGESAGDRLLLVVHHLAIDWVSWRIVLDDLAQAYANRATFEARVPMATPYGQWSSNLASSPVSTSARRFWQRQIADPDAAPVWTTAWSDDGGPANTIGRASCRIVTLDADSTAALLALPSPRWTVSPQDVVVSAATEAVAAAGGRRRVLLHLEGHGRSGLIDGLDVSRTVGWFTALYPVLLDAAPAARIEERTLAVSRQLAAVPDGGLSYGLLGFGAAADDAGNVPPAEILVNYLGKVDSVLPRQTVFSRIDDASGPTIDPARIRPHLLEIEAVARDGRLTITCTYDSFRLPDDTMDQLAAHLRASLLEAAAYAREAAADVPAADVDLARRSGFTPAQLQAVLAEVSVEP